MLLNSHSVAVVLHLKHHFVGLVYRTSSFLFVVYTNYVV
ncbi:hypothetical protein HBA_0534 [Sodalis endosymbiont of Henestaris halophilus]|nr:hypothetical protein HBA_0534 [Sodalis endosymbiont of Henestaris halophilus]